MKYFSINELCHSSRGKAEGIKNIPSEIEKKNLESLINNLLDPVREEYGEPIYVNSGYRCDKLNKLVGGVPSSHHRLGTCADITTGSYEGNKKLFDIIKDGAKNGKWSFRQLIDEKNLSWIHVEYKENDNKEQILKL